MTMLRSGRTPAGSRSSYGRSGWLHLTPALLACAAASPVALAQLQARPLQPTLLQPTPSGGFRGAEAGISLADLPTLRVSAHGFAGHGGSAGAGRACNVIATLTDASFSGGNYIIEAGMGETEMAAATYTVAASEFPIKINLTEVILATSNASQQTVTQWSLLYYSGTPMTGTLVDTFSSDDIVLPHARVGPGTAGIDIQFSVDPGDPEQLFIPDDGSHKFTVAFRIDHHNQQTQNPCSSGPPTCCNAFPCVDTGGLQNSATNWLYGLNCGAIGCPDNGGWSTFAAMHSFCRPSGDWVMRTTWSGVSCTPGVGACCKPDGTCQSLTTSDCSAASGAYQGDGSSCGTVTCPQPTGACCFSNGNCLSRNPADCANLGGTWLGAGTTCSGSLCPTGACCFANGTCTVLTSGACSTQGGTYHGTGVTCASANCPQPTGACCTSGGCSQQTQGDCTVAGGTFQGLGSACGTSCTGACCTTGGCSPTTQGDCSIAGGVWHGLGSTCPSACASPCYANCDNSTASPVLNVQDFSCFLTSYAAGCASPAGCYPNCDASTSTPFLNVQDFSCFLTRYAAGCP
jgi:hypothetical protein